MLTCEECGQEGACFCPVSDELGNVAGALYHPLCYARKGIVTHEDFQSVRRHRGYGLHAKARASMPNMRMEAIRLAKPVEKPLRRL